MPRDTGYPQTAAECLSDSIKYRRGVIAAVKAFKRSGPWKGSVENRKKKFRRLNRRLAKAYGISAPGLRFEGIDRSFFFSSKGMIKNWTSGS